ncbi:MAG TPA: Flp pilus assembly protein CpaB [Caulobacteraceae bacterium]|jgi:pilus assembly protein CpaB
MNIRAIATLAVALCLGLVAVILVRGYLSSGSKPAAPARPSGPTTAVVIAAAPIARGASLEPTELKVVSYPSGSVPAGSFAAVGQLVGAGPNARLAVRPIAANEPVLQDEVSAPGAKLTLSEALTPGMRAVSLRSNEIAGVGGFVLPGDRVDVLLTRTGSGNDQKNSVTQALAENVLVLGVDQSDDQQAHKPVVVKAITVEVTPEQAQAMSLGEAVGTLSLSLRHEADQAALARKATTVAQLAVGGPPIHRARRPVSDGLTQVRVTRGVDMSNYAISSP